MVTATTTEETVDNQDVVATLNYWGLDDEAEDPDSFMDCVRNMSGNPAPTLSDLDTAIFVRMYDLTDGLSAAG